MRLLALLPLALALAACGGAALRADRPQGPAPGLSGNTPPPAWIETRAGAHWLGYSTYCWSHPEGNMRANACADFVAPACGGSGVPEIPVHQGELVRAHLGFVPKEASLSYEPGKGAQLPPKRVLEWHMARQGVFSLSVHAPGGDASYVGCGVTP
jgi:hypothetical protein